MSKWHLLKNGEREYYLWTKSKLEVEDILNTEL